MLLALLFLIALILVLPQVDLPEYISSSASSIKGLTSHSPQSSPRSIFHSDSSPLGIPVNPSFATQLPAINSTLPPVRLITPELRC
jgi:hypothetical protein